MAAEFLDISIAISGIESSLRGLARNPFGSLKGMHD
jgi:hypothetical protein